MKRAVFLLLICAGCQSKTIEGYAVKRVPNPLDPRVQLVVRDESQGTSLTKTISVEFGPQKKMVCVIHGANSDGRKIDVSWIGPQTGSVNLVGYNVWEVLNRVGYFEGSRLAQNEEVYVDFVIKSRPPRTK